MLIAGMVLSALALGVGAAALALGFMSAFWLTGGIGL